MSPAHSGRMSRLIAAMFVVPRPRRHHAGRGARRLPGAPQPARLPAGAPLLVTIVLLLPTITLSTALQAAAGISFTAAQVVGPIAGFGILGGVGSWLLVRLLRAMPATASAPAAAVAAAESRS